MSPGLQISRILRDESELFDGREANTTAKHHNSQMAIDVINELTVVNGINHRVISHD